MSEQSTENQFLEIMHSFPLGHDENNIIVGRWYKEEDLLDAVKKLHKLKNEIIDKRNEAIRRQQEHEDKTA